MASIDVDERDSRGDWKPPDRLRPPPVFVWPAQPMALLKWLFGYPGYLWPWNLAYVALAVATWTFLTPSLETMRTFAIGWVAFIAARNLVMLFLIVGAWHFWLYIHKAQGLDYKYNGRWLAARNSTFLFGNQVLDNIFWNVASAWPIWTAYEVLMLWGYASGRLALVSWGAHPVYCVLLLCLTPIFHDIHFYLIHRLLHWPPLYRAVHSLHHKNVNVGPWSGLAMHPFEHLLFFSGVLIYWIVPSHPIHFIFHMQHLAFSPAQGHVGFERVVINGKIAIQTHDYHHYLHHKYFECNYCGDAKIPLDKWFGTYHDGSSEAQEAMNKRFRERQRRG
jgi:sterol desaturase/sphingolipid hydroxylase (fatty acid hydroxylase superfamily)